MTWEAWTSVAFGAAGIAVVVTAELPWHVVRPDDHLPDGQAFVACSHELDASTAADLEILTWGVSHERDSYLRRRRRVELTKVGALLIALSGLLLVVRVPSARDLGWLVTGVAALVLGTAWAPYLSARAAFWERRKATAAARVDRAIRDLGKGEPKLSLPKLYELNRRQLDQYQELTRKQETSAYRLAQVASFVALAVLVAGIVVALSADAAVDKYVGGGLAGLGSALSAFLAATFFKSHRQASKQLNRYYLEPQRTGRLLAAERMALQDPSIPTDILGELVTALMSWEMPGGSASPPSSKPAEPSASASSATALRRFTARPSAPLPSSPGDGATAPTG